MKLSRHTLCAIAFACTFGTAARAATTPVNIPLPGGSEVPALLEVIDESGENWKSMPITVSPSANGFTASVTTPSGAATVEGQFENKDKTVQCSIKWEAPGELASSFMMLVLIFPADQMGDALLTSGESSISVGQLINGQPGRSNFNQVASFTLGPVGGQKMAFACETPLDIGVVVMKEKDFVHVRLGLTPRKTTLPASGRAAWTISD